MTAGIAAIPATTPGSAGTWNPNTAGAGTSPIPTTVFGVTLASPRNVGAGIDPIPATRFG
jgi:hypothetical protein